MSITLGEVRVSHNEGKTLACFNDNGSVIYTAGNDGDFRSYKGIEDDDAVSFHVGSTICAFDVKGDKAVVGLESNEVNIYNAADGTMDCLLLRFTGLINDLNFSYSGKMISAASSDFNCKVINFDKTNQKSFTGHEAPVLSVHADHLDMYLASSSCDGTVKLWRIVDQVAISSLAILPKTNDVSLSKSHYSLSWSPVKQILAIPTEKSIQIVGSDSWKVDYVLESNDMQDFSIVRWSKCGKFIIAASNECSISIWDVENKSLLARTTLSDQVKLTSLCWNHSKKNEILYADNEGQFSLSAVDISWGADEKHVGDMYTAADLNESDDDLLGKELELSEDSGFQEKSSSKVETKAHRIQNFDNFLDNEADDDDMADDDDPNISLDLIKEGLLPSSRPKLTINDDDDDDVDSNFSAPIQQKAPVAAPLQNWMQKPFQSSATPPHLLHRYMVWNSTGIIKCHAEDDFSTIDIEFHDTSTHHSLHVSNSLNHTMAALSTTAAVLACEGDNESPSQLVCMHFGSWDTTKEWTVSMPKDEHIKCVAVNDTHIAVATDAEFIRIFSSTGIQLQMFSIPGPVVTMAMSPMELILTYHIGIGLPKSQSLGMQLYGIKRKIKMLKEQNLPLKLETTLAWLGFTVEGSPIFADSRGIVHLYQRQNINMWLPVANLRSQLKNRLDNYWLIGAHENPAQLRCVFCKNAKFPPILPRPIPCNVPFCMPLCDLSTDKGKMEENLIRSQMLSESLSHQRKHHLPVDDELGAANSKEHLQLLMKLFALACKSDREFRAFQVCELMPSSDHVALAIQYATRMRNMALARKLDDLARLKASRMDSDIELSSESEEEIEPAFTSNQNNSKRKTVVMKRSNSVSVSGRYVKGLPCRDKPTKSISSIRKSVPRVEPAPFTDDESENEAMITNGIDDDDALISDDESSQPPVSVSSQPSSTVRSNPFKLSNAGNDNKSAKGTSYFETLDTTTVKRKSNGQSHMQQTITTSKSKKTNEQKSVQLTLGGLKPAAKKQQETKPKKLTGFQLYLENLRENTENDENESDAELIKRAAAAWKGLSSEEKKIWNSKINENKSIDEDTRKRQRVISPKLNDDTNNKKEEDNESKKRKVISKETISTRVESKSKLASFAFQKKD